MNESPSPRDFLERSVSLLWTIDPYASDRSGRMVRVLNSLGRKFGHFERMADLVVFIAGYGDDLTPLLQAPNLGPKGLDLLTEGLKRLGLFPITADVLDRARRIVEEDPLADIMAQVSALRGALSRLEQDIQGARLTVRAAERIIAEVNRRR